MCQGLNIKCLILSLTLNLQRMYYYLHFRNEEAKLCRDLTPGPSYSKVLALSTLLHSLLPWET